LLSEESNRWNWTTLTGVTLLLFGVLFLASQFIDLDFGLNLSGNWWAWLLLLPAVGTLYSAWKRSREYGGFSPKTIGLVVGGVCMLLIVPIFLLNLDWGRVWPVFFVAAGLGV